MRGAREAGRCVCDDGPDAIPGRTRLRAQSLMLLCVLLQSLHLCRSGRRSALRAICTYLVNGIARLLLECGGTLPC